MSLMVIVTAVAYSRQSGNTGIDAAKIQKMRNDYLELISTNKL